MKNVSLIPISLLFGCCATFALPTVARSADLLGPVATVASRDGTLLFVANADAKQVAVVSTADRKVVASIEVPATPTAFALSADGQRLYVACAAPKSTICVVDTAARKVVGTIPAGHTASGLALSPDGKRLYVCNRFNNDVSVIDVIAGKEIARVPVVREPLGATVTLDGRALFVINQLPLARADTGDTAAAVTVIDAAAAEQAGPSKNATAAIPLPNGSSSVLGLCLSPDGKLLLVTHILSRYQMPTTQLDRGWMNTNALSIIDVQARKYVNTVLLDDIDRGAANPWGVGMTADGRFICVTHAGTQELSVINAPGLLEKLQKLAEAANKTPPAAAGYGLPGSATLADVPNDLSFLVGLRRRVHLPGLGPRGVAVIGSTAFVAEYFTDTLATVDLQADTAVGQIALGAKPPLSPERRGQMLFQNADLCFQHWQSCESCHPDGRADSLNWDLMNDGLGNPKNTRSMLRGAPGGPVMALGVRENSESAVRAGIAHIQFAVRPEEEAQAIDAYLKSIRPIPSPYLIEGKLSPAAERGKQVFFDRRAGCASCHAEPGYADG